ncbi:phosphonate ABC transporter ATP-binding protein [Thermococcus indicus]|uniref:Phosphonate ABC transporter ATP-binding protein n=1 Tax=Thermococcus indicus TaxID=2586643 RepID=A0A4Y5SNH7_9EURY|nr:alpha/beta hydrolase-fold protein [Thermococcus indicus]QDA31540.1 phosphonate ABC transporter ATP-binding protein [Thermococcus indicus]
MVKNIPTIPIIVLLAGMLVLSAGCLNGGGATQTTSGQSNESTTLQASETTDSPQSTPMPTSSISTTGTASTEVLEGDNETTSTATGTPNVVTVTFIVSVPNYTPENDSIYIAGDFNGWNPGDENYRLRKRDDGRWEITLEFREGTGIEFKFTRGSWETVEKGRNGEEISNRHFTFKENGIYEFTVYHWRDYVEEVGVGTHTIVGNVTTFKMFMPQLNRTRRIWVYLPPDYGKSDRRYPVLYMHDGQNLFDQATSFAGEWNVDETLEKLFRERNFSVIVVGIDNGGERRIDEYSPWRNEAYEGGGEGDAYVRFIVETLKPYIDSHYRTLPNETGIMGSSLGGLISIYAGFAYPETFRYVGAMSSAFWFNPEIYDFVRNAPEGPEKIYIDWGTLEGSDPSEMVETNRRMVEVLREKGYIEDENLLVIEDKGAGHNEYYWSRRFPDAVLWLFGG